MKRFLGRALLILVLLYARPRLPVLVRMYYVWAADYIRWSMAPPESVTGPVHVLFLYTTISSRARTSIEPCAGSAPISRWQRGIAITGAFVAAHLVYPENN